LRSIHAALNQLTRQLKTCESEGLVESDQGALTEGSQVTRDMIQQEIEQKRIEAENISDVLKRLKRQLKFYKSQYKEPLHFARLAKETKVNIQSTQEKLKTADLTAEEISKKLKVLGDELGYCQFRYLRCANQALFLSSFNPGYLVPEWLDYFYEKNLSDFIYSVPVRRNLIQYFHEGEKLDGDETEVFAQLPFSGFSDYEIAVLMGLKKGPCFSNRRLAVELIDKTCERILDQRVFFENYLLLPDRYNNIFGQQGVEGFFSHLASYLHPNIIEVSVKVEKYFIGELLKTQGHLDCLNFYLNLMRRLAYETRIAKADRPRVMNALLLVLADVFPSSFCFHGALKTLNAEEITEALSMLEKEWENLGIFDGSEPLTYDRLPARYQSSRAARDMALQEQKFPPVPLAEPDLSDVLMDGRDDSDDDDGYLAEMDLVDLPGSVGASRKVSGVAEKYRVRSGPAFFDRKKKGMRPGQENARRGCCCVIQ